MPAFGPAGHAVGRRVVQPRRSGWRVPASRGTSGQSQIRQGAERGLEPERPRRRIATARIPRPSASLGLHQPGARAVGLRGDGHGDSVVPSRVDPARRIPRRVLAAHDRHPGRHRRGSPGRAPSCTGAMARPARLADGRAGPLRRALRSVGLAAADARAIERAVTVDRAFRRGERRRLPSSTRTLQRTVVQPQADPPGSRAARAADGFQLSARERHHAARRPGGRPPRRRSLPLQHRRRRRAAAWPPGSCCCRRSAFRAARRSWLSRRRARRSCRSTSRSRTGRRRLAGPAVAAADRREWRRRRAVAAAAPGLRHRPRGAPARERAAAQPAAKASPKSSP